MKYEKLVLWLFIFSLVIIKKIYSQEMLSALQMRQSGKEEVFGEKLHKEARRKFRFFGTGQLAIAGFYDTHQFIGVGEDAVVFYPAPQNLDTSKLDIHDKDQFDLFGLNAGIKALFAGPDLWGGKVVGRFEVSFGGIDDPSVRIMNISNAYVSFVWRRTEVRFGHYYHPLALSTTYPTPVTGDEGVGFDPTRKVPLIRFVHVVDKWKFKFAVSKIFSSEESRRAALPDFFAQAAMRFNKKYQVGAGLNYHTEVPRLKTEEDYKTTAHISGVAAFIFAKLMPYPFLIKTRFNYLENGNPFGIMGSYSVQYRNDVTDGRIYVPMRTITFWADIVYMKSKRVEPGIFIAFAKDIGASKNIIKSYTKAVDDDEEDISLINIDASIKNAQYLFRIAPRIRMRVKNFILGFEVSHWRAAFARDPSEQGWQEDYDSHGKVINAKPASNTRAIFNIIYAF